MAKPRTEQNFEIASEWGVIGERYGKEIRLTKTSWFGKKPMWELFAF